MCVTDPIADMLTCIRNAAQAKHKRLDVPASKVKEDILRVLCREKFIQKLPAHRGQQAGDSPDLLEVRRQRLPVPAPPPHQPAGAPGLCLEGERAEGSFGTGRRHSLHPARRADRSRGAGEGYRWRASGRSW